MATTVDERVVAAKFDASDFEKGVDKTIKKLDELKKSLDIKETTKSVKELAEKTEESTDSIGKSLERLTDRFTTFAGMIKQKIIGGLAEEVANVFLRMEQAVTGFIKSISSDQVGAGMQKYEQMLSSVRVLMSSGTSESEAYEALEKLKEYSDQTSYSLVQMTDALAKMRAAGVDVDVATRSVIGISNACAAAGINATDASRAFYNLSQAYSSGVLKYTDYRSLELLNMTTGNFKEQLLEAAVAAGTLKKVSDGVYQTINTTNKKVTAGKKVTKDNITDMLRYNFVTTEVMDQLFGGTFFFGEREFRKYKKQYDTLDEAINAAKKDYGEVAVNAYLAAREARSFTDVINTLKDVVSTGWAQTFEYLFGRLEQAKTFFTDLAESGIAEVIYKIGEYRNAILEVWGTLDAEGENPGAKMLAESILNISDAIGTLFETILSILPGWNELNRTEEEGMPTIKQLGHNLLYLTARIRNVTEDVKKAANEFRLFMSMPIFDDGNGGKMSRITLLRRILSNLGTVFSVVARVAGIAFNAFNKLFIALLPLFDGVLKFIDKITAPLQEIKKDAQSGGGIFSSIETGIENILNLLSPVAHVLGQILGFLGEVGAFFVGLALDTFASNLTFISDFIDLITELFTGKSAKDLKEGESTLASLRRDFEGIKTACEDGLKAVNEFFTALLSDIKKLLGLTDPNEEGASSGGIFSGIINFFNTNEFVQQAKAWVDQAIIDVGDFIKDIPNKVKKFGANIYDTLRKLFFEQDTEVVQTGSAKGAEIQEHLTPLGKWLKDLIESIKEFIASIPQRIINGIGKVGTWIDTVFNMIFGYEGAEKEAEDKETDEKVTEAEKVMLSNFDGFIKKISEDIKNWFNDLPNKISKFMSGIGDFATKLFNTIDEFLFGKKVTTVTGKSKKDQKIVTTRYKTGFSKWLEGVIEDVKKFIKKIPQYISSAIKGAGDIFTTIVNAIFGVNDEAAAYRKVEGAFKSPFQQLNPKSIVDDILNLGKQILNTIAGIFTGTNDIEKNQKWFSDLIAQGIEWIRTKAKAALDWVLEFLTTLPTRIANFFTGESNKDAEQNTIGKAIMDFAATIGNFILHDLPTAILGFIENAATEFGKVWETLYNTIINGSDESAKGAAEEGNEKVNETVEGKEPEVSPWKTFIEKLGKTIANIWKDLPKWIAEGIHLALIAINDIIAKAGEWLANIGKGNNISAVEKAAKGFIENTQKGIQDGAEEGAEEGENGLLKAILGIGEAIKELLITTLPAFISAAWHALGELGGVIWEGISSLFSSKEIPPEEQKETANSIGDALTKFFKETLPAKFKEAWESLSSKANSIWGGLVALFTGTEANDEIGNAVVELGKTIFNFITTTLPNFFKSAWESLFGSSRTRSLAKGGASGISAFFGIVKDDVNKETKEANTELSNSEETKSGFWTFVDSIAESLKDALKTLGPTILNTLSDVLGFLSNIGIWIVGIITGQTDLGKEIENAYGEEQPELIASLKKIGESIKTFFMDTLPVFIGSAIGWIVSHAAEWFSKLFGALGATADAEADKALDGEQTNGENVQKSAEDQMKGVIEFIKEFITSLGIDKFVDAGVALATVFAMVMLLRAINELCSIADETEAVADVVKWAAIIAVATMIGNVVGTITAMVNSDDPKKVEEAQALMDKLVSLFEKIAWIVGLFSAGKIVDALSDIFGFGKAGSQAASAISTAGKGTTNILGTLGKAGVALFGASVGTRIFSAAASSSIENIANACADVVGYVDELVGIILPFATDLAAKSDELDLAISSIEKIGTLFETLYKTFDNLYSKVIINPDNPFVSTVEFDPNALTSELNGVKGTENFLKELKEQTDLLVDMSVFIKTLTDSLSSIQDIENPEKEITRIIDLFTAKGDKSLVALFTTMFDTLHDAFSNSKFMTSTDMIRAFSIENIRIGFGVLADALSVFQTSITELDEGKITAMNKMLKFIKEIQLTVGKDSSIFTNTALVEAFSGQSSLSGIGRQIKSFGNSMKIFYDYVSEIKGFKVTEVEDTMRKTTKMIDFLDKFSRKVKEINNLGVKYSDLDWVTEKLPAFGTAMATFFNSIISVFPSTGAYAIPTERIEALYGVVGSIGAIFNIMEAAHIGNNSFNFEYAFNSFFDALSDPNKSDKLAAALRKLIDLFKTSFLDPESLENFKEIGKSAGASIAAGIQEAFDTDPSLQITITPILNMDAIREQLSGGFGFNFGQDSGPDWAALAASVMGANNTNDESKISAELIHADITSVKDSVERLGENATSVADLTTAFSKMKIVTDTGVLAGELLDYIDRGIGQKIIFINNGITVDP